MTTQEAKRIRIADYLQSLGYTPIKQQGNSLWYKSPLREETEASFKVNIELNQWYDFGIGKGGNIIALASELYRSDNVPYLLERIAKQTPHMHIASHAPFLLVGNPFQNRCTDTCKLRNCPLLRCCPICWNVG